MKILILLLLLILGGMFLSRIPFAKIFIEEDIEEGE